jgi:hypothetical protein
LQPHLHVSHLTEWLCVTAVARRCGSEETQSEARMVMAMCIAASIEAVKPAMLLAAIPPFTLLKTNIPGLAGTTSFIDHSLPAYGPAFYLVGVH